MSCMHASSSTSLVVDPSPATRAREVPAPGSFPFGFPTGPGWETLEPVAMVQGTAAEQAHGPLEDPCGGPHGRASRGADGAACTRAALTHGLVKGGMEEMVVEGGVAVEKGPAGMEVVME